MTRFRLELDPCANYSKDEHASTIHKPRELLTHPAHFRWRQSEPVREEVKIFAVGKYPGLMRRRTRRVSQLPAGSAPTLTRDTRRASA